MNKIEQELKKQQDNTSTLASTLIKTEKTLSTAQDTEKNAKEIKKIVWWYNKKLQIFIIGLVMIMILFLAFVVSRWI